MSDRKPTSREANAKVAAKLVQAGVYKTHSEARKRVDRAREISRQQKANRNR